MTFDRQKNQIVFECDTCGDVEDTETGDFNKALGFIKEREWTIRKAKTGGKNFEHLCKSCSK